MEFWAFIYIYIYKASKKDILRLLAESLKQYQQYKASFLEANTDPPKEKTQVSCMYKYNIAITAYLTLP